MRGVRSSDTKPKIYIPLPPEQLFSLLENRLKEKIESARESLVNIEANILSDHLWNIVGYQNMIHKAHELITHAKSEIYLSIWNREFKLLEAELKTALERGVKIFIFSFTKIAFDANSVFSYQLEESKLNKIWAHKLILVADHQELLMGEADNIYPKKTAWTTNKAIVDIAINHIVLDVTLYGLRLGKDVSNATTHLFSSNNREIGKLLHEKYPDKLTIS